MGCFHCDGTGIFEGTRLCYHCRKEEPLLCKFCDPKSGEHELGCTNHPANAPGFIGPSYEELKAALVKVEGQRDRLRDELAALREKHGLCIDCGDESPFGDTACCLTCLEKHNKAIKESEG